MDIPLSPYVDLNLRTRMKKFLFDLFPLLLFFIAYRYADIYTATAVAIVASLAQILWLKLTRRPVESMHGINLAVIVVFGGATLWLHNDLFIKCKPTVLYWSLSAALLIGRWLFGRNLIERLLSQKVYLPVVIWNRLNTLWALFFLAMGALNGYIAFSGHFSESEWVTFKAFGLIGLTGVFILAQSLWLSRYLQAPATPNKGVDKNSYSSSSGRKS